MLFNRFALVTATILVTQSVVAETVTFDGVGFQNLPYTEEGLTFTNLPGTEPAVIGGGADGHLVGGTNVTPIHVRVTGSQPFDLTSLDIENIFRTWRIESSAGAIFDPTGTGTVDFTSLTGWTNLTSFDVVHDPGEANGTIRIDNIVFTPVPEPSAVALLVLSSVCLLLRRQRTFRCTEAAKSGDSELENQSSPPGDR